MRDSEKIKVIEPYKITLYRRERSPYIYYSFSLNQKQFRGSTETSDTIQATMRAEEIYWDVKHGKTTVPLKFSSVVKKFLQYKKPRVSKKTYTDYERQSRFLIEKFKRKDIDRINKSDFHNYEEWRRSYYSKHQNKKTQTYTIKGRKVEGREYEDPGNTIINRELVLLVSILRFAQRELGLLPGKTVPSWTKLPEHIREDTLSKDEYERLRKYWLNKDRYHWDIISFVQNTGLRYPSEVNRLKWKDINLKKSFILIRDRKGKPPTDMTVPLVGTAKEIIEQLQKRPNIPKGPDDYVFVNDKGRRIKYIRKSFSKSLDACGITKNITMYSLRHTYATRLIRTRPDIPLKVIAHSLGHTSTRMIDKVYGHLRIEDMVHIFEKSEKAKEEILKRRNNEAE